MERQGGIFFCPQPCIFLFCLDSASLQEFLPHSLFLKRLGVGFEWVSALLAPWGGPGTSELPERSGGGDPLSALPGRDPGLKSFCWKQDTKFECG